MFLLLSELMALFDQYDSKTELSIDKEEDFLHSCGWGEFEEQKNTIFLN